MNFLSKVFHVVRVWTGLADASESHITPSHGWLLPQPADARQQIDPDERHPGRLLERNTRA